MKYIYIKVFTLFFLFTASSSFANVDISIVKAPLDLSLKDSINKFYTIEIKNNDTINYIFYNFLHPSLSITDECCKDKIFIKSAAFSWFNVYDIDKKLISGYNKYKEIFIFPLNTFSLDSLDSLTIDIFKDIYKDCFKDKLVIKRNEKRLVNIKINIAQLDLNPGTYFIKINYVNGINFKMIIDNDLVKRDEIDNNAKVFYGCIQSKLFEIKVYK
jgi:hypothetical protein